jgi:aminopeptidase-like protein
MLATTAEIESLFDELFPIPRSITGEGYRRSLQILSRYVPFEILRTPSGTPVFDWTTPDEWTIDDAYLVGPDETKIIDFRENNLAVVNYSMPVDSVLDLQELQKHLYSMPEHPDWVPYVISYYTKNWGFCLPHSRRLALRPGKYRAVIKSSFKRGSIDCGYCYLRGGTTGKLVLISSYLCHPSMANNELSGPIILAALYERIKHWPSRRFDYLFVINPETIGSICFLHAFGAELKKRMQAGLVLTCLGGPGTNLSYKKSRMELSSLDRLFRRLEKEGRCRIRKFDPSEGSDERQYCAGRFNLPVGQVARTTYGEYPEYHTSADNKEFVHLERFIGTIDQLEQFLQVHEHCIPLERAEPYCEIQLGKRGLYPNVNAPSTWNNSSDTVFDDREELRAITYILSYADGNSDLIDVADMTDFKIDDLCKISAKLHEHGVLKCPALEIADDSRSNILRHGCCETSDVVGRATE